MELLLGADIGEEMVMIVLGIHWNEKKVEKKARFQDGGCESEESEDPARRVQDLIRLVS